MTLDNRISALEEKILILLKEYNHILIKYHPGGKHVNKNRTN